MIGSQESKFEKVKEKKRDLKPILEDIGSKSPLGGRKIFDQNSFYWSSKWYGDLTSCKKSENSYERILRSLPNARTDGPTNEG